MHLTTILTVALLPLSAVLAAPTTAAPAPLDDTAIPSIPSSSSLDDTEPANPLLDARAKKAQTCKILQADQLYCRYQPTTKAGSIVSFPKGSKHKFSCWKKGDCIGSNCTWDWNPTYRCFVSGAYTDSNCSTAKLPKCA
ncbi:hypothetical protein V494_03491 [Pseudogymnoascus sp. VKM F-4513 (FW-928)]|nr:hypothetical protein V494_03491 [Pseudogymnoascus sp. VKM F-4513 (FW-928)]